MPPTASTKKRALEHADGRADAGGEHHEHQRRQKRMKSGEESTMPSQTIASIEMGTRTSAERPLRECRKRREEEGEATKKTEAAMGGIAPTATHKRWRHKYMPEFNKYYAEYGNLNAPQIHLTLGSLINHIRSGDTSIPQQYQQEIAAMGGIRPAKKRKK